MGIMHGTTKAGGWVYRVYVLDNTWDGECWSENMAYWQPSQIVIYEGASDKTIIRALRRAVKFRRVKLTLEFFGALGDTIYVEWPVGGQYVAKLILEDARDIGRGRTIDGRSTQVYYARGGQKK